MKKDIKIDMTTGNISKKLISLAFPIMLISFMEMAYNMTDVIWLGRVGYKAVAASGTAGFYMWLSFSLILIAKLGAEIKVSQHTGAKNHNKAREYAMTAVQIGLFLGLIYACLIIVFRSPLIHFIDIKDESVNIEAVRYLVIVSFAFPFAFYNQVMTGIYYGVGTSKIPLKFAIISLSMNIVLDYLFIFGFMGFEGLGVMGAAIATAISQFTSSVLYTIHIRGNESPFPDFTIFRKINYKEMIEIAKLGYPSGIMNGLFTFFAIVIAKRLSYFEEIAVSVQRVGMQIESISWMTAGALQSALRSFTGQNLGAKKIGRIKEGFYISAKLMTTFGLVISVLMYVFAADIFYFFLPDMECLEYGVSYLEILSFSQLFMIYEMISSGAFNGIGVTKYPAIIGTIFTALRIPFAYLLSSEGYYGLDGIWWTITMSSVFKGSILFVSFFIVLKHSKKLKSIDIS